MPEGLTEGEMDVREGRDAETKRIHSLRGRSPRAAGQSGSGVMTA